MNCDQSKYKNDNARPNRVTDNRHASDRAAEYMARAMYESHYKRGERDTKLVACIFDGLRRVPLCVRGDCTFRPQTCSSDIVCPVSPYGKNSHLSCSGRGESAITGKAGAMMQITKLVNCVVCGGTFESTPNAKYCQKCKKAAIAKQQSTYQKHKKKPAPVVVAKSKITDAEQKALNAAVDAKYAVPTVTKIYKPGSAEFKRIAAEIMRGGR